MPEVDTAPTSGTMFKKSKKSGVEALKDAARQFFAYVQEHGGPVEWEASVRASLEEAPADIGEVTYDGADNFVFQALETLAPHGWKPWNWACHTLEDQPVWAVKRVVTPRIIEEDITGAALDVKPKKAPKEKKPKKQEEPKDLRSVFLRKLAALDPTTLHKPWMADHALKLIQTPEQLQAWVDRIMSDFTLWHDTPAGTKMPVVAVDTETFGTISTTGLDTRLVQGRPQIDCAGICLCADGMVSLYVPINHEDGKNLDRATVRRILQPLFDASYLVFFNSKFDREVLRLTMGLTFRDYPYFEDVQIDNYLLDPKADLDEEVADLGGQGLKDLSLRDLGMEQIEMDELCLVRAQYIHPVTKKKSYRNFLAPFNWVPTELAVLYAAGDALTTWLLWKQKHERAQGIKFPFKLDHMLVDSLTWIERQRFFIDVDRLKQTVTLHHRKMELFRKRLADLSGIPDFNPGSPKQLGHVLFNVLGFKATKVSAKTGDASTDKTVLDDLKKAHGSHPFLVALSRYRSYASLHPENLEYDPRDLTARLFFKQCTVAGGRLAAQGGGKKENSKSSKGKDDGGFGLNPQAIKGVKGLKPVEGRAIVFPAGLGDFFDPEWVSPVPVESLHESVLKKVDGVLKVDAPDVVNGVANYMGRWWSFRMDEDVLKVKTSQEAQDLGYPAEMELQVEELRQKVDSNEVVNLRGLFVAPEGYTFFVTDYSNIEMRVAANVSREKAFIDEFLYGSGDFHTLTAKAVFPEFSTTTDKAFRKTLRDLAKIINFALLYGGTEHTIFENMKKQDPTITKEKAQEMVEKYWSSVPQFAEWAYRMRKTARETLQCRTPDGRIINFKSALEAEGLHEPKKDDFKNVRAYWNVRRKAEELEKAGRKEEAARLKARVDEMWNDPDLGIRNASEYKKMVGKFERVSVNAPLQGLAGDFMRRALTLLHRWAVKTGVEGALLVHATVHDEIDYCIKNEFVPYVLPRITRLMKLRDMHALMKWPVPIECDTEYGASWDVKEHFTGDDGHVTAAYTRIKGLENYIPAIFDAETEAGLIAAVRSKDEEAINAVVAYLKETLHPRVCEEIEIKKGLMGCVIDRIALNREDPDEAYRFFVASCQLHEYWTIDGANWTLDGPEDQDETLTAYMERMGLEPFPGLGQPVLTSLNVEDLPPLVLPATDEGVVASLEVDEVPEDEVDEIPEEVTPAAPIPEAPPALPTPPVDAPTSPTQMEPEPPPPQPSAPRVPLIERGLRVLRPMDPEGVAELRAALGLGTRTLSLIYEGEEIVFSNVKNDIPDRFLLMVAANG